MNENELTAEELKRERVRERNRRWKKLHRAQINAYKRSVTARKRAEKLAAMNHTSVDENALKNAFEIEKKKAKTIDKEANALNAQKSLLTKNSSSVVKSSETKSVCKQKPSVNKSCDVSSNCSGRTSWIKSTKSSSNGKKCVSGVQPCRVVPDIVLNKEERQMYDRGISIEGIKWRRDNEGIIRNAVKSIHAWLKESHPQLAEGHSISESNLNPVICPICGKEDNDWPERAGLCCDCWCREIILRDKNGNDIHDGFCF